MSISSSPSTSSLLSVVPKYAQLGTTRNEIRLSKQVKHAKAKMREKICQSAIFA